MRNEVTTKVPVLFQRLDTFKANDTRFEKVKIWLMHINENLNGSFFSKEVVEDAIPSLANTPILAYIEINSDNELDFSDHRTVIVKTEDGYELKYLCSAYGVIPETNNAKFEKRVCDDGIEREFLTCEGLLWTKWDDPLDILDRDEIKSQSMEIHKEYKGKFDKKNGLFYFSEFKFFGALMLGEDVQPAMKNATIEKFSLDNDTLKEEIQKQVELFKLSFETENKEVNYSKGGSELNQKQKLLEKYSITEEKLQEKNINLEDYSLEKLEEKIKELFELDKGIEDVQDDIDFENTEEDTENEEDTEDDKDVEDDKNTEEDKDTEENFALMVGQQVSEFYLILGKHEVTEDEWGWMNPRYHYIDHNDTTVFTYDSKDHYKLIGFPYSVNGDTITIDFDNGKRYKVEYTVFEGEDKTTEPLIFSDFKEQIKNIETKITEKYQVEIEKLETKCKNLETFKSQVLTEQRKTQEEELFSAFDKKLKDNEEYFVLKENKDNFSIEDLEKECYSILGKQMANFSFKEKHTEKVTIPLGIPEDKPNEKSWSYLVYQYKK